MYMLVSASLFIVFVFTVRPGYYDTHNCFQCPLCTETTDILCFENKVTANINHNGAEVNTCTCALPNMFRISEPIISNVTASEYCGGDDCSCDTILSESPENWNSSQDYFECVYFSPKGAPYFFVFGALVCLFTGINFFLCLFCVVYLVLICMGCGKGDWANCVCCFLDFQEEQKQADYCRSEQVKFGVLISKRKNDLSIVTSIV